MIACAPRACQRSAAKAFMQSIEMENIVSNAFSIIEEISFFTNLALRVIMHARQ